LRAQGTGRPECSRHSYTLDAVGNRTHVDEVLPQLGAPGPIANVPSTDPNRDADFGPDQQMAAMVAAEPLAQVTGAAVPGVTPTSAPSIAQPTAMATPVTPTPVTLAGAATVVGATTVTPATTRTSTPTAVSILGTPTVTGLVSVALADQTTAQAQTYAYRASPAGYSVEMFNKIGIFGQPGGAPDLLLSHTSTHSTLRIRLPGKPSVRSVLSDDQNCRAN
jgi:hypothetical protein